MSIRVYVSAHRIGQCVQGVPADAPITVERDGCEVYARAVRIDGPSVVRYDPTHPNPAGARCWVETDAGVTILEAP